MYKTIDCPPSIYMTYDTTKLNMTKKKQHMTPLNDGTWILHQATNLMSKVHRAHRWINVSQLHGAVEGPGQPIFVKKVARW